MAICDANLVDGMPKKLTAYGGLDALVHALESYVSVCATDYTKGKLLIGRSLLREHVRSAAAFNKLPGGCNSVKW